MQHLEVSGVVRLIYRSLGVNGLSALNYRATTTKHTEFVKLGGKSEV